MSILGRMTECIRGDNYRNKLRPVIEEGAGILRRESIVGATSARIPWEIWVAVRKSFPMRIKGTGLALCSVSIPPVAD